MAWVPLPVNYTDAVWSGLKKYAQVNNADGTVSFQDETVYSGKELSFFGAMDANRMNEAMNNIMSIVANGQGHNAIYRGKYLGTAVTTDQYAAIEAGTFDDLYIGDYWSIAARIYRIAAFDYYLLTGDGIRLPTHHVTIVPDVALGQFQMNSSNTTTGGYVGSSMYTTNLAPAKGIINDAFNGHVLTHRQLLTNAVVNGKASGVAWFDSSVELMNEIMVYGSGVFSPVSDGTTVPYNRTLGKTQLPLFRMRPDFIARNSYWLRDVLSDMHFAIVSVSGDANSTFASGVYAVRPAFSIF